MANSKVYRSVYSSLSTMSRAKFSNVAEKGFSVDEIWYSPLPLSDAGEIIQKKVAAESEPESA